MRRIRIIPQFENIFRKYQENTRNRIYNSSENNIDSKIQNTITYHHIIAVIIFCSFSSPTKMGFLTVLKKMKQKEKEMRILMLYPYIKKLGFSFVTKYYSLTLTNRGLDNAGKTTILKRFNGEPIDTISPTLGFNIKTLEHRGFKLNMWDVGGQKSLRSYWRNYFECTDGLIWVVDSADKRRLDDCKAELHALLREERLVGATLLIFANKQDLPGACSMEELQKILELDKIKTHHWKIVWCSAVTGENLLSGIDWLINDISARIFTLD